MFTLPRPPSRRPPYCTAALPVRARIQPNSPRGRGDARCLPGRPRMKVDGCKGRGAEALRVPHHHTWGPSRRPGTRWRAAQAKPLPRCPPPRAPGPRSCLPAWPAARGSQPRTASLCTSGTCHRMRKLSPHEAEDAPLPPARRGQGQALSQAPPFPSSRRGEWAGPLRAHPGAGALVGSSPGGGWRPLGYGFRTPATPAGTSTCAPSHPWDLSTRTRVGALTSHVKTRMLMEDSRVCRASKSKYILSADTTVTICHLFFKRRKRFYKTCLNNNWTYFGQPLKQQNVKYFDSKANPTEQIFAAFKTELSIELISNLRPPFPSDSMATLSQLWFEALSFKNPLPSGNVSNDLVANTMLLEIILRSQIR